MDGAPPGAWAVCHPSGWIQTDLFLQWFEEFVKQSGASKSSEVLLILDGHSTHTKNVALIDLARENGVTLLCLPPHCTHKLQPLDVAFMKPLSTFYDHSVRKWLREHPGRVVTQFQIARLFGEAYLNAASMTNTINGFRKTGVWPVDRLVFKEVDFLTAAPTDLSSYAVSTGPSTSAGPSTSTGPSTSAGHSSVIPIDKMDESNTSFNFASPEKLVPLPKSAAAKRATKHRGATAILTTSPYKKCLLDGQNKKKVTKPPKGKGKGKAIQKKKAQSITSEREDDDTECLYCKDLYSRSHESWVACSECQQWAHYSCAGLGETDKAPHFTCELCDDD